MAGLSADTNQRSRSSGVTAQVSTTMISDALVVGIMTRSVPRRSDRVTPPNCAGLCAQQSLSDACYSGNVFWVLARARVRF